MEGLMRYRAANREVLTKYDAKSLVIHGQQIVTEGTSESMLTLVEFPNYQAAVNCFNTPEYGEAAKIHSAVAEGLMVIVEGYKGPPGFDL